MTDRELIEKLATEFFGWQFTDDIHVIGKHLLTNTATTVWYWHERGAGVAGAVVYRDFDPLHDPAACALVKAELQRRGWWFTVSYADDEYSCRIHDPQVGKQVGFAANIETEERALCLATLKALGVD